MEPTLSRSSKPPAARPTIAALQTHIAQLEAALAQRERTELLYLSSLRHATSPSGDIQNLRPMFEAIVTHAGTLLGTKHGLLQLLDERDGVMRIKVGIGIFGDYLDDVTKPGRGITGKVWESGQPLIVEDYDHWNGRGNSLKLGVCRAMCAAPIRVDDKIIGIIALAYSLSEDGGRFTEESLNLLSGFADVTAMTLNNARLYDAARRQTLDRLQVEEALSETEENYRDLFRRSPNINFLISPNRQITDANDAALRVTGFSEEELKGRDIAELFASDQREVIRERFERALQGLRTPLAEFSLNGSRGARTILLPEGHVPLHKRGTIAGFVVSAIDITELKWAEEELANTYALLMAAIRNTTSGIIVAEAPEAAIRIANPAALALRGVTNDPASEVPDALHNEDWKIHRPDGTPYLPQELPIVRAVREGKVTRSAEVLIYSKDGAPRWVLASAAPVVNQKGAVVAGISVFTDITEHKRAEQLLRGSEEKFRSLFEESRDAIYITAADGRFIDANPAALELFGYARDDLFTIPAGSLYENPQDREAFRAMIEAQGYVRDYSMRVRRPDGTILDCLETASLRRDDRGKVIGYQGIIRDITETKRAISALSESEEKFRTVTEQALIGVFIVKGYSVVFANSACADMIGYTPEEMQSWTIEDFKRVVYSEDHELVFSQLAQKLGRAADTHTNYEFRLLDKQGRLRWISLHSNAIRYRGEHAVAGAVLDITDRKSAEEELKARYALESLITSISTHFINLAPGAIDEGIREAIQEIGEFAGAERAYFLAVSDERHNLNVICEWTAPGVAQTLAPYSGKPISSIPWLADRLVWAEAVNIPDLQSLSREARADLPGWTAPETKSILIVPILSGGKVIGAIGFESISKIREWSDDFIAMHKVSGEIFANALERKRMDEALRLSEAQFRQAQKMEAVGQLAGGVAHDFNNLLTVISGNTELMINGLTEYVPIRKNAEEIQKAADRAANLVRQLLAFSRKQTLEPRVVSLNDVINDMRKMIQRLIGEDVDLTYKPATDLWNVKVDPAQFQQVLINLAVNARDAMPEGGKIRIETRNVELTAEFAEQFEYVKPGKYVLTSFSDTGMGMSDEVRARIFLPFFTTKGPGKGTGLGLSMVYGIVKQSSGYILVYSEPNKGATFNIYLPMVTEQIERMAPKPFAEEFRGGTETILIVEDEPAVRDMAVNALTMVGYNIMKAESGMQAMEICRRLERQVDLVLTDMIMPQMGGFELSGELRRLWPHVKIMFMSGYSAEAAIQKGMLDPEMPYIQKPFRLGYLTRRVRDLLDGTPSGGEAK